MPSTDDLVVHCYTLTHDLISSGRVAIPVRSASLPGGGDAEVIAIVGVRHLLHRCSESGFLGEIRRDHVGLFPRPPLHGEFNRRARHGAHTFGSPLTRTTSTIPAHTLGLLMTERA